MNKIFRAVIVMAPIIIFGICGAKTMGFLFMGLAPLAMIFGFIGALWIDNYDDKMKKDVIS